MIVINNKPLRKALRYILPPVLAVFVIATALYIDTERSAIYACLVICVLALLFFIAGYEKKKTGTRRMIISIVMITLSVVGRFIPLFKPVTALTVISAIYLGPEAGFLVGSMSALISGIYFTVGPWTPFQMLAWGMIGLISGLISGYLKKSFPFLIVWGGLTGVLFSFIMDIWNTLWVSGSFDLSYYAASIKSAAGFTLLYALSNVIFLLLLAKPLGRKLERMKIKYGI